MSEYTPTIGIEVHAELKTKTKMFCASVNDPHAAKPNTHVCPVCMAHPGTLPTINKEAVKHVLKVGIALKANLATYTEFDRKNYFYPDIPKGYQISQYQYPLVSGGMLADVKINRVHLEEDTARSLHDQGDGSIVDFNRAGVPLMELVTEPVIHDSKTAGNFARELQLLLKTLGASDANMERGEMRVEANVSISKTDALGTKVEVKNINSFKAVEAAIEYEIKRQTELLGRGVKVTQETRGWDENKSCTFSQRAKETAHDYRYYPDPDLPKLDVAKIEEFSLSRLSEEVGELPLEKRTRYGSLGLPRKQIEVIITTPSLPNFFDAVASHLNQTQIKLAGNYVTTDLIPLLSSKKCALTDAAALVFAELITLVDEAKITSRVAKDILPEVILNNTDPRKLATERGLLQDSSEGTLAMLADEVIAEYPDVVKDYKNGKESSIQFLVGQGMRKTNGAANPQTLRSIFEKKLT